MTLHMLESVFVMRDLAGSMVPPRDPSGDDDDEDEEGDEDETDEDIPRPVFGFHKGCTPTRSPCSAHIDSL